MIVVLLPRLVDQMSRLRRWPPLTAGTLHATEDYFWSIPADQLFSPAPPNELTAGQLFDSAELTRRALQEDRLVRYNCVWVADLLRGLSDAVVSTASTRGSKPLQLSAGELIDAGLGALEAPGSTGASETQAILPSGQFWIVPPTEAYDVLKDPVVLRCRHVTESLRLVEEDASAGEASTDGVRALADLLDLVGRASV